MANKPLYPHVSKSRKSEAHSSERKRFTIGKLVTTMGVNNMIVDNAAFAIFVTDSLRRHATGDWGDLPEEDKKENDYSLQKRLRLLSAYYKPPLPKIWIITDAARTITAIMFPEDYS